MPLPQLQFHVVNAFAPTPHAGNQAAVVIIPADDPRGQDDKYMQTIAADFNLSETAFLVPIEPDAEAPKYSLRWFTPGEEVPLCGHATLASAFTLFNYVHKDAKALRFQTRWRGELGATMETERGQGSQIGLSLPIASSKPAQAAWTQVAVDASGLQARQIRGIYEWDFGRPAAIVQISEDVDLKNMNIAVGKLLPTMDSAVIFTQVVPKESTSDVVAINSRVFYPGGGIDEDPVTGSAWATLTGYYLSGHGSSLVAAATGSDNVASKTIDARQLSTRGGTMSITLDGDRAKLVGKGFRTGYGTLESFE